MTGLLLVAKKYAQAFLNVYADELSLDDFKRICVAAGMLRDKRIAFFLRLSAIDAETKRAALYEFLQTTQIHPLCKKLVDLLLEDNRSFLIHPVLVYLCVFYKKRKGVAQFTIASSHPLKQEELEILQQFLVKLIGCYIIYSSKIDKKLIAGIRLQSNEFLWEHSIRKQLACVEMPLIR